MNHRLLAGLALAVLPVPSVAEAACLFINVNDAPTEVAAARRGCEARGEELVVYPPETLSEEDRERIRELRRQINRVRARNARQNFENEELSARIQTLSREVDSLLEPYQVSEDSFREAVRSIRADEGRITSMVVSGHSRGFNYFGDYGSMDAFQIHRILEAEGAAGDLESVYLMGCYTATPMAARWWSEHYPNLIFTGGFKRKAPLSTNDTSPDMLEAMLRKEPDVRAATTDREILRSLNRFRRMRSSFAAGVRSCYYDPDTRSLVGHGDLRNDCENSVNTIHDLSQTNFVPYLSNQADESMPDPPHGKKPPCNTIIDPSTSRPSEKSGRCGNPLAEFYDLMQSQRHCWEEGGIDDAYEAMDMKVMLHQAYALRYSDAVERHFENFFSEEIARARELLAEHSDLDECAPSSLPRSFSGATRRELHAASSALYACGRAIHEATGTPAEALTDLSGRMSDIMLDLSCVPVNWLADSIDYSAPESDPRNVPPGTFPGCQDIYSTDGVFDPMNYVE